MDKQRLTQEQNRDDQDPDREHLQGQDHAKQYHQQQAPAVRAPPAAQPRTATAPTSPLWAAAEVAVRAARRPSRLPHLRRSEARSNHRRRLCHPSGRVCRRARRSSTSREAAGLQLAGATAPRSRSREPSPKSPLCTVCTFTQVRDLLCVATMDHRMPRRLILSKEVVCTRRPNNFGEVRSSFYDRAR